MDGERKSYDDMQERESKTGPQIPHGKGLSQEPSKQTAASEAKNVQRQVFQNSNRYFAKSPGNNNKNFANKKFTNAPHQRSKFFGRKPAPKNNSSSENVKLTSLEEKEVSSPFVKPFQPYEPIIFNPQVDKTFSLDKNLVVESSKKSTVKNPFSASTSQIGRNSVRKQNICGPKSKKIQNQNQKVQESGNNALTPNKKLNKAQNSTLNQFKQNKIDLRQKMKDKKQKSNNIRNKNKNVNKSIILETISIEETDSNDDDVVCIPVSPPPLISLDESDEETFQKKPKIKNSPAVQKPKNIKVEKNVFSKPAKNSQTISSADDDVVCIPAPPPPLISLDESDEEISPKLPKIEITPEVRKPKNSRMEKNVFTKPTKPKKIVNTISPSVVLQSNNSSRCTSPCSTMSADDFISSAEKSRLNDENTVNDEDLMISETVESFVQRQNTPGITEDQLETFNAINMPPPSSIQVEKDSKTDKKKEKSDYVEKQNCYKTVNVYAESESDISVYSKGSLSTKKETPMDNLNAQVLSSTETSSSPDIDEQEIIQKVKRLRKRRSSSNKGSDMKMSDDSENEINDKSTTIPYISKGEAVEKIKKRRRISQANTSTPKLPDVSSSDTEFIKNFTKIVRTKNINDKSSEKSETSENEEEQVTARKIAEDVIFKSKKAYKLQKNQKKDKPDEPKQLIVEQQPDGPKQLHEPKQEEQEQIVEAEQIDDSQKIEPKQPDEPELLEKPEQQDELVSLDEPEKNSSEAGPSAEPTANKKKTESFISQETLEKAYAEIDKMSFTKELCREKTPEMISLDITQSDIDEDDLACSDEISNTNEQYDDDSIVIDGVPYYQVDSHSTDSIGWCEEMHRFYNMSWGGEEFTVKGIKHSMDRKANWNIHSADRYPKFTKSSKLKCFNCCEFGHIAARCVRPRKPMICYMCGETGHREPRCPNTKCLKCGAKTLTFTKGCKKCAPQTNQSCFICNVRGHHSYFCPDKWRRYHSTITPSSDPNTVVNYNKTKHCSVCASRGHLPEQCKYAKIYLEHQPSTSQIKHRTNSNSKEANKSPLDNNKITYNLLYKPNNDILFRFSKENDIKISGYYGRFAKAAKLDHMLLSKDDEQQKSVKKSKKIPLVLNPDKTKCERSNQVEMIAAIGTKDHQFKPPNKVTEKIKMDQGSHTENLGENVRDANKSKDQVTNKDMANEFTEDFHFDSDSNYSFSDHFDVATSVIKQEEITNEDSEKSKDKDYSKPQRISRPMGDLSDFIPLSTSDTSKNKDKENESGNFIAFDETLHSDGDSNDELVNKYSKTSGISHRLRRDTESDNDESSYPDISCVSKIFLPKNYSDYLLSPEGNKFLIESSTKYNLKASIDWTSIGNVLLLEGLKSDQTNFHMNLMVRLKSLPKQVKNDVLERSIRVPRKRSILIKFLIENLERLDFRIGNVFSLNKQLKSYENQQSKNGLRQAQKIRSKLNMILLGQAGLRQGKLNLDVLMNHLLTLLKENTNQNELDNVTTEQRDEIDKSWKYIFSPFEHTNYDELIDIYYNLKRQNEIPTLKIRDKIKDYNNTTFEISTKETPSNAEKFLASIERYNEEEEEGKASNSNQLKRKHTPVKDPTKKAELEQNKIQKLNSNPADTSLSSVVESQAEAPTNKEDIVLNISYTDSNTTNINNNNNESESLKNNEIIIEALLNEIVNADAMRKNDNDKKPAAKMPSPFWSKESISYLNQIIAKDGWSLTLKEKFQKALSSAINGHLSHNDYRNIIKIKNLTS